MKAKVDEYLETRLNIRDGDSIFEEIHIHPSFGRRHEMDTRCWCLPERDVDEPQVIHHRIEH